MKQKRDYKKEYLRRKQKLIKKGICKEIPKDYVGLIRLIVKILRKSNLKSENDKELLINSLKRLQDFQGLSIENMRYLILREFRGNKEIDAKECMNLKYGRMKTEKEIRKLKKLLKEQGVEINPTKYSYKDWSSNPNIGLKVTRERTFRFFRIK